MSEHQPPGDSNVVSLAEFASRMGRDEAARTVEESLFQPIDLETYNLLRTVHRRITSRPELEDAAPPLFAYIAEFKAGASVVTQAETENGQTRSFFAVEPSYDELEALKGDLIDMTDPESQALSRQLQRWYIATLVGKKLVGVFFPGQRYIADLSQPHLGEAQLRVEDRNDLLEQNREWTTITRWRFAAGVALSALNTRVQGAVSVHLDNIQDDRVKYKLALQATEDKLGRETAPDDPALEDFLTGVCNPLDRFSIRKILDRSNHEKPDSHPE